MRRYTVWALSAVLLFSCSAGWAQQSARTQVLPLKLYRHHMIVVQGSIGSLEKRNLVIDTGAYPSIIDRAVAEKLQLFGHAEELDVVNQTVKRIAVVVPSVAVGGIQVSGQHFLVDDLSAVSRELGVRIDGLIGLDVLSRRSFRIDYAAKKIYFGPVAPLPFSAPLEVIDAKFCLRLQAGRGALHLLIDTGAENTLLFGSRLPWLTLNSRRSQEFTNLAGRFALREISLDELQLGDVNLSAQPIYVSEGNNLPPYQFDGFLSTSEFEQIAFDFERHEFSWMTKDRKRVRVAAGSADAPPYVALSAGPVSNTAVPPVGSSEESGGVRRWLLAPFGSKVEGR